MNKIKNNKVDKQNKGISLIVLVITIIVIIILAAAVMLSIDDNNPIENAKKAKQLHNESVYQEELELYAMKEYSNGNSAFNKDALNVFDGESLKKYITSMLDEDKDKYIIWQGKLVKKDGKKYVYLNGEQVMMFGKYDAEGKKLVDQEPLTETRLNFAKEFQAKQNTITDESERLIYNGGYITNCLKKVNNYRWEGASPEYIKSKLPDNIVIKSYNLSTEKNEEYLLIGTQDSIFYTGTDEVLARTIVFGDVDLGTTFYINYGDTTSVRSIVSSRKNCTLDKVIASDINGDGILTTADYEMHKTTWPNFFQTNIQNRPAIIPKF